MSKIQIKNINKLYKKKIVLKNINLSFEDNKIYGLLGRNGAGKSTLMNLISNREFPTTGEIILDGEVVTENEKAQNQMYLSSEKDFFNKDSKIKRIFKSAESFYGSFDWDLAAKMVDQFGINIDTKFSGLSTGYKSIAKLIIALCLPVRFVFLDEPILGLDANHRDLFYEFLIDSYRARPRTFVVATHIIEEMEKLFEHVIIIKDGTVVDDGDLEEILKSSASFDGKPEVIDSFGQNLDIFYEKSSTGTKKIYVKDLNKTSEVPGNIHMSRLDLQDYFVGRTN